MLVALLALASGMATSQAIYRCGQTYSRVACPNAKTIDVASARPTAAERAEGREVARREKRLADEMARDRRLAEAAQQPALATSLGPARAASASAAAKPVKKPGKRKRKAAQPDAGRDFVATVPRVRKAPN